MNNELLPASRQRRKQKATLEEVFSPSGPNDLVHLGSLGTHGQQKARRLIEAGEIETCRRGGKLYSTRAELADWDVIYFDATVTIAGEFLGDNVQSF